MSPLFDHAVPSVVPLSQRAAVLQPRHTSPRHPTPSHLEPPPAPTVLPRKGQPDQAKPTPRHPPSRRHSTTQY